MTKLEERYAMWLLGGGKRYTAQESLSRTRATTLVAMLGYKLIYGLRFTGCRVKAHGRGASPLLCRESRKVWRPNLGFLAPCGHEPPWPKCNDHKRKVSHDIAASECERDRADSLSQHLSDSWTCSYEEER